MTEEQDTHAQAFIAYRATDPSVCGFPLFYAGWNARASLPSNPEHDTYGAPPVGASAQIQNLAAHGLMYLKEGSVGNVRLALEDILALAATPAPSEAVKGVSTAEPVAEVVGFIRAVKNFTLAHRSPPACYEADMDAIISRVAAIPPATPAVAVQAEPAWCDACSQMVGDQCPSGMCEMKKGVEPERQDPLSRTRDEHSPGLAEPIVRWKNLDAAMKDPLFQSLRGVMGTANYGQDDALFRVLSHFEAAHPKPAAPATADEAVSDVNVALEAVDVLYALTLQQSTPAQRIDAKIALKRAILALRSGASAQPAGGAK